MARMIEAKLYDVEPIGYRFRFHNSDTLDSVSLLELDRETAQLRVKSNACRLVDKSFISFPFGG